MRAYSIDEAFNMASKIMEHDFEYNVELSSRAGYPIYTNNFGEWISDLCSRLEVNTNNGCKTTNIFIYSNRLAASGLVYDDIRGVWVESR